MCAGSRGFSGLALYRTLDRITSIVLRWLIIAFEFRNGFTIRQNVLDSAGSVISQSVPSKCVSGHISVLPLLDVLVRFARQNKSSD